MAAHQQLDRSLYRSAILSLSLLSLVAALIVPSPPRLQSSTLAWLQSDVMTILNFAPVLTSQHTPLFSSSLPPPSTPPHPLQGALTPPTC